MRKTNPLEIAVVVVCVLVLVWLVLQMRGRSPDRPRNPCINRLKQLGLAMKQYSYDFGDRYPWRVGREDPQRAWLDLAMLYPNYTSAWNAFFCPVSRDRSFRPRCLLGNKEEYPLEPLHSANNWEVISYAYGIDASDPDNPTAWTENARATVRLLADKKAGIGLSERSNHRLDGRNVLYNDGHVKWKPGPEALDPDEDQTAIGPTKATDYKAWWSDPPYNGE